MLEPETDEPTAPLTRRQADVLNFLRQHLKSNALAPTLAEIGRALGIHRVTVLEHVNALKQRGWISNVHQRSRSIRLKETELRRPSLCLAGTIAAGRPIEAISDADPIYLEDLLPTADGNYLLRVRGDSMIEDQIRDGDYVLVSPAPSPNPGDTVVALIDDTEATLKRFYPEKDSVRLEPRNPAHQPITVHRSRLKIQGVLRAVIRTC